MKNIKGYKPLNYLLPLLAMFSLSGCMGMMNVHRPENYTREAYATPKIKTYDFRNVVLLSMPKDDTTDTGTFYSTSHFFNQLKSKFPKVEFELADIGDTLDADSTALNKLIKSADRANKIDLAALHSPELDSLIKNENPDALIFGTINNIDRKNGYKQNRHRMNQINITTCDFTYYMISIPDGKIIWKARIIGEASNLNPQSPLKYPPLDSAISNGIDRLMNAIPLVNRKSRLE